ncbi:MAG: hypothetical protein ACM3WV_11100 [Bacillota bacterium]
MKKLIRFLSFLFILALGFLFLEFYFDIPGLPVENINKSLSLANGIVFNDLVTGVSIGTALFILSLLVFPFLTRHIDTRLYFKSIHQGIISAFVFYVSDLIYDYIGKLGNTYLLTAICVVILLTIILIQISTGIFKKQEDRIEFRTSHYASIAAGLIFGVLLNLGKLGMEMLEVYLPK